jgi:phosphoribosylanthranilate isomerase
MALVTKVKAANITNLSDARYCAGMGVDWIGFPAEQVNTTQFKEISGWLSGPQWVIELPDGIRPAVTDYAAQIWQCELNDIDPDEELPVKVIIPVFTFQWAAEPVKEKLHAHRNQIVAVLIRCSGELEKDKAVVEQIQQLYPVLIDLQYASYSLSEILTWPITGINVHGTSEERPGLKDYAQLAEVLEKLEAE